MGQIYFKNEDGDWKPLGESKGFKTKIKQKNVQIQIQTVEIDVWQWIIMTYPRRYG